jgi:hypothetical protein
MAIDQPSPNSPDPVRPAHDQTRLGYKYFLILHEGADITRYSTENKAESTRSISEVNAPSSPRTDQYLMEQILMNQENFDLSRQRLLGYNMVPIRVGHDLSSSTTLSTYRLRWNWIQLWDDFGNRVHQYWENVVTQDDKQENVYTQNTLTHQAQTVALHYVNAKEGDVQGRIDYFVVPIHNAAANGLNGAPRPSDGHSIMGRLAPGVQANQIAGIPDFLMVTEFENPCRVTAIFEVKNPWQITPAHIDEVINGT